MGPKVYPLLLHDAPLTPQSLPHDSSPSRTSVLRGCPVLA